MWKLLSCPVNLPFAECVLLGFLFSCVFSIPVGRWVAHQSCRDFRVVPLFSGFCLTLQSKEPDIGFFVLDPSTSLTLVSRFGFKHLADQFHQSWSRSTGFYLQCIYIYIDPFNLIGVIISAGNLFHILFVSSVVAYPLKHCSSRTSVSEKHQTGKNYKGLQRKYKMKLKRARHIHFV